MLSSLTLTSEVVARYREGGTRYRLNPVACQVAVIDVDDPPGPNLELTHVSVHDSDSGCAFLRQGELEKAKQGATQIVLGALGTFYVNVFLGDKPAKTIEDDLNIALTSPELFISMTIDDGLEIENERLFGRWLAGDRSSEDVTMWTAAVPKVGVVRRP